MCKMNFHEVKYKVLPISLTLAWRILENRILGEFLPRNFYIFKNENLRFRLEL